MYHEQRIQLKGKSFKGSGVPYVEKKKKEFQRISNKDWQEKAHWAVSKRRVEWMASKKIKKL